MIGEFFISLFGSLYYGGKYASDKAAISSYDRAYQNRSARREAAINRITNAEAEEELSQYLIEDYKGACEECEAILKGSGFSLATHDSFLGIGYDN